MLAFGLLVNCTAASAQQLRFIRDTEIEQTLADYASPVLRAAGLGGSRVKIRIIQDSAFNAFVLDGRNIFMNTGTLMQAESPNEVIGVIAHESGHIAAGHLAGLRARIRRDSTRALLMKILGIGAMIAGATAGGDTGRAVGGAGQGILTGGDTAIMRSILTYRRSQESSADQAGISYLNATKQSAKGMLETFERFASQEVFNARQQDVYVRSHPMARQRITLLNRLARQSPYFEKRDSPALQLKHDLMRAKLSGFLNRNNPRATFNRYPSSDQSLPARYGRAIASFFQSGLPAFLPRINALIKEQPQNPYFREVKGEMLITSGRSAQAVVPLRKAISLKPKNNALIRIQLAKALLAADARGNASEAIRHLRSALVGEKSGLAYRNLARAYAAQGRIADANLATAQGYFYEGKLKQAKLFATRAQTKFKRGTPAWIKANDILTYSKS